MKKHMSTFVLILVIAGLITALFYTGKSLIGKNTEIAVLKQQNEDLNKSVEELNKKVEDLQDEKTDKEPEKEEKIDEKTKNDNKIENFVLDVGKISNAPEGTIITENIYANNGVLSVSADNESKSLNIALDGELARQIYGYKGQSDNHTIAALSEKVVDIKVLNSGKGANSLKVVILTESGKVKYIDIANILDKTYTMKSVDNVENIVRITGVSVEIKENSDISYSVVGIKADGTAELLTI